LKTLFPPKQSDQSFTKAAIAKPLITENNAKRGKRWYDDHKTRMSDDWKYVIWSDDSSITLFTTSCWVYVWKMPKEAYNPEVKNGNGSVMIWAAISQYSAGPIIALNGKITASDYVDILGDPVNPVVQMFPNDAIFQDDSSHIHSQNFSVWLEQHEDALHLPWPAQSPYLNTSTSNCCVQF